MTNLTKLFNYEGNAITFKTAEGVVYVNATQMAKPFGKRPVDFLQNQNTEEFIQALSEVRKSTSADLVVVKKGGIDQGTWMHEDVAIEFSRWLSPKFAIWCNDHIKQLLTTGTTSLTPIDFTDPKNVLMLAENWAKESDKRKEAEKKLAKYQPMVDYTRKVINSDETLTVRQVADGLNMTATKLNNILCERGIQFWESGMYHLYANYKSKGYATIRTSVEGFDSMVWTQRGKAFIHLLLNPIMTTSKLPSGVQLSLTK